MNADESPDWYVNWAIYHAACFDATERCTSALLAWGPLWAKLYTEPELRAATHVLLADATTPRYVADQRGRLLTAIESERNRRRRQATRPTADKPETRCTYCNEIGLVIVPHPGLDDRGRMAGALSPPRGQTRAERHRTMAVTCLCDKGRKCVEDDVAGKRTSMTLETYAMMYPNWQAVQVERDAVDEAERRISTPSGELVTTVKAMAQALARSTGLPRRARDQRTGDQILSSN
jgi:hypothetical protein